jgi:hypothetical protein
MVCMLRDVNRCDIGEVLAHVFIFLGFLFFSHGMRSCHIVCFYSRDRLRVMYRTLKWIPT